MLSAKLHDETKYAIFTNLRHRNVHIYHREPVRSNVHVSSHRCTLVPYTNMFELKHIMLGKQNTEHSDNINTPSLARFYSRQQEHKPTPTHTHIVRWSA